MNYSLSSLFFPVLRRSFSRLRHCALCSLTALALLFAPHAALAEAFTVDINTSPITGLWSNANEPGWGIGMNQQGPTIFATWFTYDQWGTPLWYVMSSCALSGNACSGDVFRIDGGARLGLPWTGSGQAVSKVGSGTFTFADNDTAAFSVTIDGVAANKSISRMSFGSGTLLPAVDRSALWWSPGESGWGVSLTQQYGTIFAAVFTYVAGGNPVWYVAPDCVLSSNYCEGTLYRAAGGSAPTQPWLGAVTLTPVGSIAFEFTDASNAVMRFTLDGQSGARIITKTSFYNAADILAPSASLAGQCVAPRPSSEIDPSTGRSYGDLPGSLNQEMAWIRSFVDETYLWYGEVPLVDPFLYSIGASVRYVDPKTNNLGTTPLTSTYDVVDAYFNSQRTLAYTASGKPKDQFHFTYTTGDWTGLSTSGNVGGFGFEVALLSATPPRKAVVAYTFPGTPATQNNLLRGTQFLAVNGVDVVNGSDVATLNEALFSPVVGRTYTFQVLDPGSSTPRTISMTAVNIALSPVQNVATLPAPNNKVGYFSFTDHIAPAEKQLIDAVAQLKAANNGAGISDLVLDLRYNGGGYLDIAAELAYMIAGPTPTAGKIFEQLSFNDKNPFGLSAAESITPFHAVSQGFSTASGQALPQLGLSRVFVITGSGTCSASEAIINGLRGVGVTVIQIGGTTCGKPYGFFPQDNCGTTYFAIQFKGVNNSGFGDYADGFVPGPPAPGVAENHVPGCVVSDDFTRQLGDPNEARLAAALQYRANGTCPSTPSASGARALRVGVAPDEPLLIRSPLRENRFLLHPPTRR